MDLDYTSVVGTDRNHLNRLCMVWPTWRKNKPSMWRHPLLVIYDRDSLTESDVRFAVDHPQLDVVAWPPCGVTYAGDGLTKWTNPQRYKVFAGYVHCPAKHVRTAWWLNLAADIVATGNDDWISPAWFQTGVDQRPAIIGHRWSFTKPPEQMLELDRWVVNNYKLLPELWGHPALDLVPTPGSDRLSHPRIESLCAFFSTEFVQNVSRWCEVTCGLGQLPVPSEDGTLWYCAARLGLPIVRTNMKSYGWECWNTDFNIRASVERAMQ